MSDGDDETADAEDTPEDGTELDVADEETLRERLDDAEAALEDAETEAALDAVEATLDAVADDLEAATLPEPDDEDEEGPRAELEDRLSDLREGLEAERGPYAADVVDDVEAANSTVSDTRWTATGEPAVVAAVADFVATVGDVLDADLAGPDGDYDEPTLLDALDSAATATTDAGLDADADAGTIADLLAATDDLATGLEDAEEWDDLQVHEQLAAEGFYDVLGHYKDFPPELSAIKEHEKRGNVEMIVMAMESLGSEFMIDHCVEALTRMNDLRAFDAMHAKAQRRDKAAIKALGKMAATDAVDTLIKYVDTDSDPGLQKVTFRALGEIGDTAATQPLADKLVMDNDNVRPYAARALGLLGDTRAVDPLTDVLADDDSDNVRAAAAWALRQIGTEAALEAAADHVDDRSYLVQYEAEQAAESLEPGREAPAA